MRAIVRDLKVLSGLPIPTNFFEKFLERRERGRDVFRYIEAITIELSKSRRVVLVIDELQVIGDLKIDDLLIYRLFNLFVRLTKELHCCHVFAVTSDSLFMERVFNEAMLQGRCRYLLVDDFDYQTTASFLRKHGFSEDEIRLTWNYFGGKPAYLVEAIGERHRLKEFCETSLRLRRRQIKDALYGLDERFRKSVLERLSTFKDEEIVPYDRLTEEIVWCVRHNILFVDPMNEIIKPQSRLNLLAIRKILEEFG